MSIPASKNVPKIHQQGKFSPFSRPQDFHLFALTSEKSTPKDFWQLMKPGVMSLVVFSAFVGTLLAPGTLHPFLAFVSTLAIALGSGAAAVFNMWYDRDIDTIMARTQQRPLPAKRIAPHDALTFAVLLTLLSLLLLLLSTNELATGLLAFSIFFYAVVYTVFLKRSTAQNIVIGGLAGAFPPAIGWAAKTGELSLFPLLLVAIIFIWTPSHFWALALYRHEDYQKAKVPMLPVTAGLQATKIQIFIYSVLLVGVSLIPPYFQFLGITYTISASLLGGYYVWRAAKLFHPDAQKDAMKLFGYSIFYLFALFTLMIVDQAVQGGHPAL